MPMAPHHIQRRRRKRRQSRSRRMRNYAFGGEVGFIGGRAGVGVVCGGGVGNRGGVGGIFGCLLCADGLPIYKLAIQTIVSEKRMTKKKKEKTYASSRSKPSFRTPVTFRIVSKLFVASANILCNVTSAALANTTFLFHYTHSHFPTRRQRKKTAHPRQPTHHAAKQQATSPSMKVPISYHHPHPSPLSRCAGLLCPPGRLNAPVPVQQQKPFIPLPLQPQSTASTPSPPALLAHRCGNFKINPLAGSGNGPPAYLDTTPMTWRIVCTIFLRASGFPLVCFRDGWTTGWTYLRRGGIVGLR